MTTSTKLFAVALILSSMSTQSLAAVPARGVLTCAVTVDYVLTAQDGTPIDTETYEHAFIIQPGVSFEDDFSTPTRVKLFTASVQQGQNRAVVTITYFNDVSTFNSVEFNTQMAIVNGQTGESTSGSQTFSTSSAPLSGHYTTSYDLTCRR
jgi:hypothetical protein